MAEKNYMIKIAETKEELEGYYALRHEVFVDEQKIFTKTDRDKYDEQALPMIAKEKSSGVVIGTVRCYLVAEKTWIGGRFAVRKTNRGWIGVHLIREAVKIMQEKGCRDFSAYVQKQNVNLFEHLGWVKTGESVTYHGVYHEKMAIDMNRLTKR